MKKSVKIALVALLAAIVVCALVACNGGEISIEKMPQVTYVVGQELNLSAGTLRIEGKAQSIAMDSPEVTVEGYDKNKLGEQELTLTYKKMTTTLTVKVVERFTVVRGVTTDYFVNEPFDGRGYFTLTTDNGQSISVAANANGLISSFDTSKAGTVSIPLSYQGYTGSFNITVHEIDDTKTELYLPKTNYKSHEPLSVDSGYLILKNSAGTVAKQVPLMVEMVTGYNPSLATIENNTSATALSQTLTIKYLKYTTSYTIKITYSDVTFIHDKYDEFLAELDDKGEIDDDMAGLLFDAVQVYFTLSRVDKTYIKTDELTTMVQVSAAYGFAEWFKEQGAISHVLDIDAFGRFAFVGESYEATKAVYDVLTEPDCRLVKVGKVLAQISDEFGTMTLPSSSTTIANYLSVIVNLTNMDDMVAQMAYMFKLYELIGELPTDATVEQWKSDYSDKVEAVADAIIYNNFDEFDHRQIFAVAASWRMADFYDKLYQYYLDDEEMLSKLMTRQLPGEVETLYAEISNAYEQYLYVAFAIDYYEQGTIIDASLFMMYYRNSMELLQQLVNSDNELYRELYSKMTFVADMQYLQVYGYQLLMMSLNGNAATNEFFRDYVDMVAAYVQYAQNGDNYLASDEFEVRLPALFNKFLNLSPIEQLGVINAIYPANTDYYLEVCLDLTGHYSLFTLFLDSYYRNHFDSDNAYLMFYDYLHAVEYYALINGDEYYVIYPSESYFQLFADIVDNRVYNSWYNDPNHGTEGHVCEISEGDRALLKGLRDLLNSYRDTYRAQNINVPDEWTQEEYLKFADLDEDMQELFTELRVELNTIMYWYDFINVGIGVYSPFISHYENLQNIANQILNSGNQAAIDAYRFRAAYAGPDRLYWTMEYAVDYCRCDYVYFLSFVKGVFYDKYQGSDLQAFLAQIAELLEEGMSEFLKLPPNEIEGYEPIDAATVSAIIAAFRSLSLDDKDLFMHIDSDLALYYRGLKYHFKGVLSGIEEISELIDDLQKIEISYLSYVSNPDADNAADKLNDLAETLNKVYQTLKALADYDFNEGKLAGNADFQILLEMYEYYQQAYEQLQ